MSDHACGLRIRPDRLCTCPRSGACGLRSLGDSCVTHATRLCCGQDRSARCGDAGKLFRAGLLRPIAIPTVEQEGQRAVVRRLERIAESGARSKASCWPPALKNRQTCKRRTSAAIDLLRRARRPWQDEPRAKVGGAFMRLAEVARPRL